MARYVIRYLLEGDGTVPKFVEDGGYFPLGEELVGISVDEDKRHLPSSVVKMTEQGLVDRLVEIKAGLPSGYLEDPEQIAADFFAKL